MSNIKLGDFVEVSNIKLGDFVAASFPWEMAPLQGVVVGFFATQFVLVRSKWGQVYSAYRSNVRKKEALV